MNLVSPVSVARTAAFIAAAVGIMVLCGWATNIDILKSGLPGFSTVKPNAALSFALAGAALWLLAATRNAVAMASVARLLAGTAAAIGILNLLQYATAVDLGIDQLLFVEGGANASALPGRLAPIAALNFILFAALVWLQQSSSKAAAYLFIGLYVVGLLGAYLAVIGYAYGVPWLYQPGPYTAFALLAAVSFIVLFIGASASRPDLGWIALLRSDGAGGSMARRLLPAVLLLPPLLGWFRILGERAALYDTWTGVALFAISNVIILTAIVWQVSLAANRLDAERRRSQESLGKSEDRLRASEERHRQVVNLIQEAIWIHRDGTIVFANPAAAKLFGADTPDALIGRSIFSFVHPDDRAGALERTRITTVEQRPIPIIDMRFLGLDGKMRIAAIHALPLVQDGKVHSMASARDVTSQREAEIHLHQAQKMESVGQLTGGVAHDFNNLLTVIIGGLDAAMGRVPAELRSSIEGPLRAAERGAGLVRQMLAFSRRQMLQPQTLGLNGIVSDMADLLRRTLGEDIEIEMKLDAGLWPALADKGQVENALLNLTINARDAMSGGGKLTIETGNARLDDEYAARNAEVTPGEYAMLAVTDTGAGMTLEVVARAFEPFFTTKEHGKGSGLGLSMIYGFAKQSGGHLKIYSEIGHGTTVRLYLPRQAAGAAAAEAPKPGRADQPRGGESILVVEDDELVRKFTVAQLRDLGYRVVEAADAPRARKILDSDEPIDLMFTDVVMPGGMTGRQLAEVAQRRRPGLKTLYTSGYTENSIVHQGKLDPGVHFLSKPFRRQDLAVKVREVLDAA